ncbi:Lachrymatory-factor synthase [Actinidia chinensis var. chinensis]|uniref:Lachrymatory-factor synthase n=1 Tax=Actinidia chinensis var. chinensis TaxID=1590841 RepID=A0A2R6QV05_ACTCC|nr:Lachrymatory-factor synthase [Actinidia chinensis var. chinensis]
MWPLLEDFFNIHKWNSLLETCYGVEGKSGQPGCIRYCSATSNLPANPGERITKWALEKLVEIDRTERSLSYEFVDNNIGYNSHMATMKLLPFESCEGEGSEIVWSFVVNPVEGSTLDGMVSFYDSILQGMAQKMEQTVRAAKQNRHLFEL